ncbi:MAG: hypothetical protein K2L07_05020 [Lachnospiraceae bacterium]|nr:hypothetical protein [Lachnospiraceae bacterium]
MKNRKRKVNMKKIFFFAAIVFSIVLINDRQASAVSWKKIKIEADDSKTIIKHGLYYFKYASGYVYVSRSKYSGYIKTPMTCKYSCTFLCDGAKTYYMDRTGKVLYQYYLNSCKKKRIKRIVGSKKDFYTVISAVYKNNIYLTCGDDEQNDTCVYNIAKKKVVQKIRNCSITDQKGRYAVSEPGYNEDGEHIVELYKLTASGLKKIKQLSNDGDSFGFIDGKLYYSRDSAIITCMRIEKRELYRCNPNGKGIKKLGEFSSKTGKINIYKVTGTYCIYGTHRYYGDDYYKYNYKTRKRKKVTIEIENGKETIK